MYGLLTFEIDTLIFIPTDPYDKIGHSDGMVRFYNNNTVLINNYGEEDKKLHISLISALHNAGLDYITIPYNPYLNKKGLDAKGIYINYLQMEQAIILPSFSLKEDDAVVKQFEELFPDKFIKTVKANELAKDGGI